jgi:hypothetical protein
LLGKLERTEGFEGHRISGVPVPSVEVTRRTRRSAGVGNSGHLFPRAGTIRETLAWLDRYVLKSIGETGDRT